MTPLEFRHEIAAIKALGEAGVERLEGLYHKVEVALGPSEPEPLFAKPAPAAFVCGRCQNIQEAEADFPDHITATRLRIGSGETAEYIHIAPLLGTILDRLVAGRGKIQSYETLIFHAYYTGVHRPGQKVEEPECPENIIHVMICQLRKKLVKLKQKIRIETRHGQGFILMNDGPKVVLELN